jgi:nucleoside phosphorylase
MSDQRPVVRLGQTAARQAETAAAVRPVIAHTPPLPAIDFGKMGQAAPGLPQTPNNIPPADVVVFCWADAEWAALQHVFVSGNQPMPYSDAGTSSWGGWKKFSKGIPGDAPRGMTYWGYYRLVTVGPERVLLFKSNVHLDEGQTYLEQLVELLIQDVTPKLILSTGTAGGARLQDAIGTVNVVSAGTLFESQGAQPTWPVYSDAWRPASTLIGAPSFRSQLFAIPTTSADLQSLATQFNKGHHTTYALADLDPGGLDAGAPVPAVNDLTPKGSLLTATSFVVANTNGNYANYACVEMDDAVIGKVCNAKNVQFGFVRNISDPVQNGALPAKIQGDWGSFVYEAYGFYTSYNGALAAWAILSAATQ